MNLIYHPPTIVQVAYNALYQPYNNNDVCVVESCYIIAAAGPATIHSHSYEICNYCTVVVCTNNYTLENVGCVWVVSIQFWLKTDGGRESRRRTRVIPTFCYLHNWLGSIVKRYTNIIVSSPAMDANYSVARYVLYNIIYICVYL